MQKVFASVCLAICVAAPSLAWSQEIQGNYLCLTQNGQFDAKLAFKDNGLVILDFVTQEMVDNSPDLAGKMNIPGEYEVNGDVLIVSYFDGAQRHIFNFDDVSMSSDSMGLTQCLRQS
ncbi:hypothetical protein [Yoonia sp. R2-816]|uniref:hypothetical protein n=1 Tax=Yoonia sp. R2-816 TaxID=3342638 RepID=UPI0037284B95